MIDTTKEDIRRRIWMLLEEKGIARFPRPVYGRIPNFKGAEDAAKLLSKMSIYRDADVVKVNPDSPQFEVRRMVLRDGKRLIVPSPRISSGFLLLDPSRIPSRFIDEAATIKGSFKFGKVVEPQNLPNIDLIVLGSVAVSYDGWRLGKGEGYGEIEYAILREFGKVCEDTPIATTVHTIQIVKDIPHDKFDLPVDYIITESRIYEVTPRKPKPIGIYWDSLPLEKIEEIPLLKKLWKERKHAIKG